MLFALTPLAVTRVHAKQDTLATGIASVVGVNTSVFFDNAVLLKCSPAIMNGLTYLDETKVFENI